MNTRKIIAITIIYINLIFIPFSFAELIDGLLSHWGFDEVSGTTAYDSAGDNDGNINGATMGQTGVIGNAFSFDGNDYIVGSDAGYPTGTSARTLSLWAKPTELSGRMAFAYGDYSSTHLFAVGMYPNSTKWFVSQHGQAVMGNAAVANEWIHVVFTYDGSSYKIYENGLLTASGSMSTNTFLGSFYIGRDHSGGYYYGLLDEIAIWDRVLTSGTGGEIEQLYNMGLTGTSLSQNNVPEPMTFIALIIGIVMFGRFLKIFWK